MILSFKTKKEETSASANVVDGKLILTFPDAVSPVVWQMELAEAKASALEVEEDEAKGHHKLVVKTAKGERLDVATFKTRAEAMTGLMAASTALQNAHGQIRSSVEISTESSSTKIENVKKVKKPLTPAEKKQRNKRWATGTLALVILFILFSIWSSTVPRVITTGNPEPVQAGPAAAAQDSSGVAVSADDFLSGQ